MAMADPAAAPFDPASRLSTLQGRAYLEAKWRKVWFTGENPRYAIDIDAHAVSDRTAVMKATVTVFGEGGEIVRRASDFGSETPDDFVDYIEKAATKALARALDSLGYGTAAAMDDAPLADTPVAPRRGPAPQAARPGAPTPRQVEYLEALLAQAGRDAASWFGKPPGQLTRQEVSEAIEALKQLRPAAAAGRRPAPNGDPGPEEDGPPY